MCACARAYMCALSGISLVPWHFGCWIMWRTVLHAVSRSVEQFCVSPLSCISSVKGAFWKISCHSVSIIVPFLAVPSLPKWGSVDAEIRSLC